MCEFLEKGLNRLIKSYGERKIEGEQRAIVDDLLGDLVTIMNLNSLMVQYDRGNLVYAPNRFDGVPLRLIEGQKVIAWNDIPDDIRTLAGDKAVQMFGDDAVVEFPSVDGVFIPFEVYSKVRDTYERTIVPCA